MLVGSTLYSGILGMDIKPGEQLLPIFPLSPGTSLGLAYLGVVLSSILYGISCSQAFTYFRSRRAESDRWHLKLLVVFVGILDSAHQALVIYAIYYYVILEFANPLALVVDMWAVPTSILINLFVGLSVQCFRTTGIWSLSNNIWVTGFCGLWKIAALGTGVGALAACMEFASLIAFVLAPSTLYNLFFNILIGKMYMNSLLAILNSREFVNSTTHMKTNQLSAFVRNELMHVKINEPASLVRSEVPLETGNRSRRRQQSVTFIVSRPSDSGLFSLP
ncbi:hypothetical protein NM688_g7682 [Phlebia brevispora]|uniref:Uncharacterized protein n=1 Tax=Phlebia brevispora TaxID=194682 RepID=A0ACC1S2A8_9APHY|nr:hypothetical protein NM688_g7682 [Phlebia brevispora]